MPIHFYIRRVDIHNRGACITRLCKIICQFSYIRRAQQRTYSGNREALLFVHVSYLFHQVESSHFVSIQILLYAIYVYNRKLIYFLITGLAGIRDLFELDCGFKSASRGFIYICIYWYCPLNFIVSNNHGIFREKISVYERVEDSVFKSIRDSPFMTNCNVSSFF